MPRLVAPKPPTVAVVLPGGGTRGAYEVGALSVLLPVLEARGEHIAIFCGTSVGAINAVQYASTAHLSAAEQAEAALAHWREMRKQDVINSMIGPWLPVHLAGFAAEALGIVSVGRTGLLDPRPLRHSLERWIDWTALHRNVRRGPVRAACVVATSLTRSGPVAFTETVGEVPSTGPSDEIQYLRCNIAGEHIRASAAIPMLFPPVEVTAPRQARGFYIDGGTRLNSPIKPALNLGADRIIVVGFEPFVERPAPRRERPTVGDVAANVLDGLLVDRVSADLQRMVAINSFFAEDPDQATLEAARAYRLAKGREPYTKVSYALVAPRRRGELGRIAERVYRERYGGLKAFRDLDFPVLGRMLGGARPSRGELLSFLLFDERFVEELIAAGARDARRWLARHPDLWCQEAGHDFPRSFQRVPAPSELELARELRAVRGARAR